MNFINALCACLALVVSQGIYAKQYNQSTTISPEQRVKVDKAIAKSRVQSLDDTNSLGEDSDTLLSEGESNTGCGKLSIGHVDTGEGEQKYGRRPVTVDRDIIITGDVINVATGCNRDNDE